MSGAIGARAKDGVRDMTLLSNIDEHGINTNLRVRYTNDQIYVSTAIPIKLVYIVE